VLVLVLLVLVLAGEEGFLSCYVAFYICESYFSTVFLSSGSGNLNVSIIPPCRTCGCDSCSM